MAIFDLYGFALTTIEEARARTEDILGLRFVEHESSYWGGVYFMHGKMGQENFKLVRNLDLIDKELLEPDFPDHSILLYVNASVRSDELKVQLETVPNVSFLRRNVVL